MTNLSTKGQAACLVLGEPVTEANRVKCKAIVNETPFDIVYTLERGKDRPIAIGKAVAERDPITYLQYRDTPSPCHVASSSLVETNDSDLPHEGSSCELDSVESCSSSCESTDSSHVIKPTKSSVMDLLHTVLAAKPAKSVTNHYTFKSLSEKDIFDLVKATIPDVGDSYTINQISKWLNSDGKFGRSTSIRQGYGVIKGRKLWVLKSDLMEDALNVTFNRKSFLQTTQQTADWVTVGYCRKSLSKETKEKRVELLQKMVTNLHVNDLCEKVFVSPICQASSCLLTRDASRSATAQSILEQLRFQDGDMQDLLMFAKTTKLSIRLVVLDYAGLSTSPTDVRTFFRNVKAIKRIVVDHGHKLESFYRSELHDRKLVAKFDCRKAPVKRSTL